MSLAIRIIDCFMRVLSSEHCALSNSSLHSPSISGSFKQGQSFIHQPYGHSRPTLNSGRSWNCCHSCSIRALSIPSNGGPNVLGWVRSFRTRSTNSCLVFGQRLHSLAVGALIEHSTLADSPTLGRPSIIMGFEIGVGAALCGVGRLAAGLGDVVGVVVEPTPPYELVPSSDPSWPPNRSSKSLPKPNAPRSAPIDMSIPKSIPNSAPRLVAPRVLKSPNGTPKLYEDGSRYDVKSEFWLNAFWLIVEGPAPGDDMDMAGVTGVGCVVDTGVAKTVKPAELTET